MQLQRLYKTCYYYLSEGANVSDTEYADGKVTVEVNNVQGAGSKRQQH